jgi:hypothetical protein
MRKVRALLPYHGGPVVETPAAEFRYIEGLLRIPLGSISEFSAIPASGPHLCRCGRTPTALDIVSYAVSHKVHEEQLLRDTEFTSSGYWTRNYLYV